MDAPKACHALDFKWPISSTCCVPLHGPTRLLPVRTQITMANRSPSLDELVFSIADLKIYGNKKLPKQYRGTWWLEEPEHGHGWASSSSSQISTMMEPWIWSRRLTRCTNGILGSRIRPETDWNGEGMTDFAQTKKPLIVSTSVHGYFAMFPKSTRH